MADKNIRKEVEKELSTLKDKIQKINSAVDMVDEARNVAQETITSLKGTNDNSKQLHEKLNQQIGELKSIAEKLNSLQESLLKSNIPEELKKTQDILNSVRLNLEELDNKNENRTKGVEKLVKDSNELAIKKHKEINDKHDYINNIVNSRSDSIESSLVKLGKDAEEHHKNSLKAMDGHYNKLGNLVLSGNEITKRIGNKQNDLEASILHSSRVMIAGFVINAILLVLVIWNVI